MKSLLLLLFLTTSVTAITRITAITAVTAAVIAAVPGTKYECFTGADTDLKLTPYKKQKGCVMCGLAKVTHYGSTPFTYKFCAQTSACNDDTLDTLADDGQPGRPTLAWATCCCADNCNEDSIDASDICGRYHPLRCSTGMEFQELSNATGCTMCGSAKITVSSGPDYTYKFCSTTKDCTDSQLDGFATSGQSVEASCCCGPDDCNSDRVDAGDVSVCGRHRLLQCSKNFESKGEIATGCTMCGSAEITTKLGSKLETYKFCSKSNACTDSQLDLLAVGTQSLEASCCCQPNCNSGSIDTDDVCANYTTSTTTTSSSTTTSTTTTTTTTDSSTTTTASTTTATSTTTTTTTITTVAARTTTTQATTAAPKSSPAAVADDKGAAKKTECPIAMAFLLTVLPVFLFP